MYFISADDELLIFIDKKNGLEIIARELSTETNFNGKEINNEQELLEFASTVKFPSHGIILRKSQNEKIDIYKNIKDIEDLKKRFHMLYAKYNSVYAQTDMRAMDNPTRMRVIQKATANLIQKILSECPGCKKPGFGITIARKGLKCSLCGCPTKSTLCYIYKCQHCDFEKEEMYPNQYCPK